MDLDYLALILIAVMLRLLSIHIIVYARLKQEDEVWHSVAEMEAEKSEQFQKENAEADPEE